MTFAIGVDIGGTKIASAIIDTNDAILFREELPSVTSDAELMFTQVIQCIERVIEKSSLDLNECIGMGVGVPGKIDRENGIAIFQNNLPWNNFPLVSRLQSYFSINNIILDNDVYMATFAEWRKLEVPREETFVYITISTGISCATIQQGKFMRGAGFAGEVGLFPVKSSLHPNGIERFEQVAAGPAIQEWAKDQQWTTKEVLAHYKQRDPAAMTIIHGVFESIAHACYAIICTVDPHKIVFGGGVINHHPYLLKGIKAHVENYLISEQTDILNNMYVSQTKGDAGMIGAGLMVL